MTPDCCAFCGRHPEDCPGGLWRLLRSGPAICRYCVRAALRAFAEAVDPDPTPIALADRRQEEAKRRK